MRSRNLLFRRAITCAVTFLTIVAAFGAVHAAPGEFTALTDSPVAVTSIAADPNTSLIYAQENGGTGFYSYNAATNSWTTLAPAPLNSGNNGGAAYANGYIYTIYTDNSALMGVYNIAANTWSTVANPLGSGTGNITSVGNDLYLASGNNFIRYNVVSAVTTTLASPPFSFNEWGGLEPCGPYIYGHQGNGSAGFAVYNISNNTWKKLPNVPGGAVLAGAIDTENGFYYAYGPYSGNSLYIYNLYANIWSKVFIPAFSVNDGGMAYINSPGYEGLYLVQGESGTKFARFESYPFSYYGASVNGAGTLANSGGKVTTSFFAVYNKNGLAGGITWTDKINNINFQSTSVISIVTDGNEATIYGVGKLNGVDGYNFVMFTEDSLPSVIGRGDSVVFQINNGWYSSSSFFNPGDSKVVPGFVL